MSRFIYLTCLLVVFLCSTSCKKEINGTIYNVYKIRKHYSKHGVKRVAGQLQGEAMFTESCIYDLQGYDQINKLTGISIDKKSPHTNSLRIGWRCINLTDTNNIELLAYYYVDGERLDQSICVISTSEPFSYTLTVTGNYHISITSTTASYEWDGPISSYTTDSKSNWLLYPYFGGQKQYPGSVAGDKICTIYLSL